MPMKVILLQHTQDPERVVAQAAKLCYSPVGVEAIAEKLTEEKIRSFIKMLNEAGHLSAFEHASFTFAIEGVSRVLTHQLVRHRIASYSQQSQRYVVADSLHIDAVVPEKIDNSRFRDKYRDFLKSVNDFYQEMVIGGIPQEDARYILPNATPTKIVVTMNARELLHFFALRCCERAQREIRGLADEMLRIVKPVAPNLFKNAGPGCVRGGCPEGPKFTCENIAEVREKYERL